MTEVGREEIEINRIGAMRLQLQYHCDSRTEALTQVPLFVDGLQRTSVRASPWSGGTAGEYLASATYEGLSEDPDPSQDEYQLITEERETKIESFSPRDVLIETYGATVNAEGLLKFPATLPKPKIRIGQPLTLGTNKGAATETPNPLHNTTTYGVPNTSAIWRLVRKKVPAFLERQSRTVIDRLPSGFDYTGPPAKWYVRPLQKRKIGNAWEVEWQAFEVSEFADLTTLYTLQARDRKGRGGGAGLLVTGL